MKMLTYRVIIEPDEKNTFHGYVPALPGCHTWDDTIDGVKKRLHEAIELYVEDMVANGEDVLEEKSLETFETIMLPERGALGYA